jgi:hypothetical protein
MDLGCPSILGHKNVPDFKGFVPLSQYVPVYFAELYKNLLWDFQTHLGQWDKWDIG